MTSEICSIAKELLLFMPERVRATLKLPAGSNGECTRSWIPQDERQEHARMDGGPGSGCHPGNIGDVDM